MPRRLVAEHGAEQRSVRVRGDDGTRAIRNRSTTTGTSRPSDARPQGELAALCEPATLAHHRLREVAGCDRECHVCCHLLLACRAGETAVGIEDSTPRLEQRIKRSVPQRAPHCTRATRDRRGRSHLTLPVCRGGLRALPRRPALEAHVRDLTGKLALLDLARYRCRALGHPAPDQA